MVAKKQFTPEQLAEAKRLYEQTLAPVDDIAAMLGLSRTPFYRRVKEYGWRGRRARVATFQFARALAGTAVAPVAPVPAPADQPRADIMVPADPISPQQRYGLAQRIMSAAERELDAIERILEKVAPNDHLETEYGARTVASISRTLREIAALNTPDEVTPSDEADNDPIPLDIDEFRNELARRIRALVEVHRGDEGESADRAVARIEPPGIRDL